MRGGTFGIAGEPPFFDGYTNGESWNGWDMPYFKREVAEEICEMFAKEMVEYVREVDVYWKYIIETATIELYEPDYAEYVKYPGIAYTVNGEVLVLFAVGTGEWVWEEILEN